MAFVVKIEELNNAANDYGTAASDYETAYTNLIEAMKIRESSWSDQAGESWRDITAKANEELAKIQGNLESNKKLLSEVASAASETQSKVTTGINNIYG